MAATSTIFVFLLGGLASLALVGLWITFVGIPEEWKQTLAREAMERMGESYATDTLKGGLDKIPDSNQRNLRDAQKDLGGAVDGLKQRANAGGISLDGLTGGK